MDPHERAQLENEGLQQAESAIARLRDKAMHLRRIVVGPQPPAYTELAAVNQTKSSPIADYVRRHPRTPLVVRVGLAVLALAFGGCLVARKFKNRHRER